MESNVKANITGNIIDAKGGFIAMKGRSAEGRSTIQTIQEDWIVQENLRGAC